MSEITENYTADENTVKRRNTGRSSWFTILLRVSTLEEENQKLRKDLDKHVANCATAHRL